MPITSTVGAAIRNQGGALNRNQRNDAQTAIGQVQYADLFRSGARLANTDTMRIDCQGITSTGFANVQMQINNIRGSSTVAAVLIAPTVVSDRATVGQQGIVMVAVQTALNQSLQSRNVITLTGNP